MVCPDVTVEKIAGHTQIFANVMLVMFFSKMD
jgi:hypothetical protein